MFLQRIKIEHQIYRKIREDKLYSHLQTLEMQ
jgi:hypothetical protein